MRMPLAVIVLFFVLAGGGGDMALAQNITKDGDLTATEFDELGFDPTGLVGWWSLDDGNALDGSGKGNDGTISGAIAATDRFNLANKALSLNGTVSNYIEVPGSNVSTSNLAITGAITISAWVNFNALAGYETIAGRGVPFGNPGNYGYSLAKGSTGQISFDIYSLTTRDGLSTFNIWVVTVGEWAHIVATWDGTTNVDGKKIYINGITKAKKTSTISEMGQPNYYFRIGKSSGAASYMNGAIDEVKIFNRALTADEILKLYNFEKEAKFSIDKTTGKITAAEFIEGAALEDPVKMRSTKQSLSVKGQLIEQ